MVLEDVVSPEFQGRVLVLATMHHKEQVIAPIVERDLGVKVVVPQGLDTDRFGTFTRDRERLGTQVEAARLKAKAALVQTGETLAIASEGTFGPHPSLPIVSANRELVLLLDTVHELELVGQVLVTETNFQHQTVKTIEEALAFAQKVGFPAHGLVAMSETQPTPTTAIAKGIVDELVLRQTVEQMLATTSTGTVHLETDMRALYNPTRMQAIAKATLALVEQVRSRCPVCGTPGFRVVERRSGLPCELCGQPTSMTLSLIYQCQKCGATEERVYPEQIEWADPRYCEWCNP